MKTKKVILHPGTVRSQYDGDRHFITARMLMELYHVLPTDIVIIYNGKNGIPDDRKYHENWIDLYPDAGGGYEDIHRYDDMDIMENKDFKI